MQALALRAQTHNQFLDRLPFQSVQKPLLLKACGCLGVPSLREGYGFHQPPQEQGSPDACDRSLINFCCGWINSQDWFAC